MSSSRNRSSIPRPPLRLPALAPPGQGSEDGADFSPHPPPQQQQRPGSSQRRRVVNRIQNEISDVHDRMDDLVAGLQSQIYEIREMVTQQLSTFQRHLSSVDGRAMHGQIMGLKQQVASIAQDQMMWRQTMEFKLDQVKRDAASASAWNKTLQRSITGSSISREQSLLEANEGAAPLVATARLGSLEQRLDQLENELSVLKITLQSHNQTSSSPAPVASAAGHNPSLVQHLAEELQQAMARIDAADDRMARLDESTQRKLESLSSRDYAMQTRLAALEEVADTLKHQQEHTESAHEEQSQTLSKRLQKQQADFHRLVEDTAQSLKAETYGLLKHQKDLEASMASNLSNIERDMDAKFASKMANFKELLSSHNDTVAESVGGVRTRVEESLRGVLRLLEEQSQRFGHRHDQLEQVLQAEISARTEACSALRTKHASLLKKLEQERSRLSNGMETLASGVAKLRTDISTKSQQAMDTVNRRIADVEAKAEAIGKEYTSSAATTNKTLKELADEVMSSQGIQDELQDQIANAQQRLADVGEEISVLQTQSKEMRRRVGQWDDKLSDYVSSVLQPRDASLSRLEATVTSLESDRINQTEMRTLQQRVAAISREMETMDGRQNRSSATRRNRMAQLQALHNEEAERLAQDIHKLRQRIAILEAGQPNRANLSTTAPADEDSESVSPNGQGQIELDDEADSHAYESENEVLDDGEGQSSSDVDSEDARPDDDSANDDGTAHADDDEEEEPEEEEPQHPVSDTDDPVGPMIPPRGQVASESEEQQVKLEPDHDQAEPVSAGQPHEDATPDHAQPTDSEQHTDSGSTPQQAEVDKEEPELVAGPPPDQSDEADELDKDAHAPPMLLERGQDLMRASDASASGRDEGMPQDDATAETS